MVSTTRNLSPVFIVGCPRSGTTLLAQLLSELFDASIVESHFIIKYYAEANRCLQNNTSQGFLNLLQAILKERPVQQWQLDINPKTMFEELRPVTYVKIVNYISTKRAQKEGTLNWGDKTPYYMLYLNILHELYPEAKFVGIVRDGRDVALSLLRKNWGPNNVYACAQTWQKYNTKHRDLISRLKNENLFFEIFYEKLLQEPANTLRELADFFRFEIDDMKIDKLTGSINSQNFYKWKRELSRNRQMIFESIAGDTLQAFDYELVYDKPKINALKRLVFKLHDKAYWLLWFLYDNTINAFRIKYLGMQPFAD